MTNSALSRIVAALLLGFLIPAVCLGQDCNLTWPGESQVTNVCSDCCNDCCPKWYDGLELFAGLAGSKQPQDFGVNAQFGGRLHANWGIPVWRESGIGFQIGTAVTQTDHAVAVTEALEGSSSRTQSYITAGIFQRSPSGWNWGLVYDHLYEDDYDQLTLGQIRGAVSYELNNNNELGFVSMLPVVGSHSSYGTTPVYLRPLAQGRLYWRHWWQSGVQTTGWIGAADSHGQANIAIGDGPATGTVLVFGADFQAPLSDHFALYGRANFVTPADTGTVDAYLGISFYPGGGAWGWQKRQSTAFLPVAGAPSFSVDLRR